MKKEVYLLSICDNWHSWDSVRLLGVFSSKQKAVRKIKKYCKENNAVFSENDYNTLILYNLYQTQEFGRDFQFIIDVQEVL